MGDTLLMKLRTAFRRNPPIAYLLSRFCAIAGLVAIVLAGAAAPVAAQTVRQLAYRVVHATYGNIGTYLNVIENSGDQTTVKTTVHLKVSMLGIVMHREDAQRTEQWKDNRLISFHGVTDTNGKTVVLNGQAQGDKFVIHSPLGTIVAPASVRPANPWSANCLQSTAMMRVDSGRIEAVKVGGGEPTTIQLDGTRIPVREYQIVGSETYNVWFDQQGVPVKFSVDGPHGKVTFSLER